MTCNRWDVVSVPFPFSDRHGAKRRPAVVLSNRRFNLSGHTVLCMITTKSDPPWPGDHPVEDLAAAGLPVACIVRLKLFTLDARLIVRTLGRLADADRAAVGDHLARALAER